jgi:hypothetical protein
MLKLEHFTGDLQHFTFMRDVHRKFFKWVSCTEILTYLCRNIGLSKYVLFYLNGLAVQPTLILHVHIHSIYVA